MKKIILSTLLIGSAVIVSAQKNEVAEAKKIWNLYDLTMSGPEQKKAPAAVPERPAGMQMPVQQKGVTRDLMINNADGIADNNRKRGSSAAPIPVSAGPRPSGPPAGGPPKAPTTYVGKQLNTLYTGLKHTDLAIVHEKTKNSAEAWAYRALFASTVAVVDTLDVPNSLKYQAMAEEAVAKGKSLNPGKEDEDNLTLANMNVQNAVRLRGVVAYNRKDYASAYDQFLLSTKLNPSDTAMYANVGYMAKEMKNYPEAIAQYKKAISLNAPESKSYYFEILKMNLVDVKDTAAGLAVLKEASAKYPETMEFLTLETDIYIKQGQTAKAEAMIDKLLAKDPNNPLFLRVKADTYFNQAYDVQSVIKKLEDAKKYKEADVEIKKKTELLGKALPIYLKIETINPKDIELVKMIKQIYFALGNEAKAAEYSKKQESLN